MMKEKGGAAAAMNGLEKITGQILAQAREEAEAWEEKAVSSLERELE